MTLLEKISEDITVAMKAKDQTSLRSLRMIKAALLLLQTREGGVEVTAQDEMDTLVKMAKQRRESLEIYEQQGREDLANTEREELEVISRYLPKQLSPEEVRSAIANIISSSGAQGMKDMGKVMGLANQQLKGQAEGKLIAQLVKELLSA